MCLQGVNYKIRVSGMSTDEITDTKLAALNQINYSCSTGPKYSEACLE